MQRFCSFLILFLATVLVLPAATVCAGDNPFEHKLPFKTAIVAYAISGSESGTETLYVTDYGRKRARLRDTAGKILFVSTKTHTLELTDPDWKITIDLDKKTGTKTANMTKLLKEEFERLSPADQKVVRANLKKMGDNPMGAGQVETKKTKYMGHACDEVTLAGTSTTVLSGTDIAVKSEMSTMGITSHVEATKIDIGTSVTSSHFAVPGGIKVTHDTEQDESSRRAAKSTLAHLADPQAVEKGQAQLGEAQRAMEESGHAGGQGQSGDENPSSGASGDAVKQGIDALKGLFQ